MKDERLRKCVISDGSATDVCVEAGHGLKDSGEGEAAWRGGPSKVSVAVRSHGQMWNVDGSTVGCGGARRGKSCRGRRYEGFGCVISGIGG